jgi:hypothetical protein
VSRNQVRPARLPHLGMLVVQHDQEERRDGHHLPRDEEQHRVLRHQHKRHAGREQVVAGPGRTEGVMLPLGPQISRAIDRRQRREAEHRNQKPRRQRIHQQRERPTRRRPGAGVTQRLPRDQHPGRRVQTQTATHDRRPNANQGGRPRTTAAQERGNRPGQQQAQGREHGLHPTVSASSGQSVPAWSW